MDGTPIALAVGAVDVGLVTECSRKGTFGASGAMTRGNAESVPQLIRVWFHGRGGFGDRRTESRSSDRHPIQ